MLREQLGEEIFGRIASPPNWIAGLGALLVAPTPSADASIALGVISSLFGSLRDFTTYELTQPPARPPRKKEISSYHKELLRRERAVKRKKKAVLAGRIM